MSIPISDIMRGDLFITAQFCDRTSREFSSGQLGEIVRKMPHDADMDDCRDFILAYRAS